MSDNHPFAPQPAYTAIVEARKSAEEQGRQGNVKEAVRMGLQMQRELENKNADDRAVDHFARIMKEKLAQKRSEGRSGWQKMSAADLTKLLHEHVTKGDPVDVANIAMMIHLNGLRIEPATDTEPVADYLHGMPPQDVIEAAQRVEHYFASKGIRQWELYGVASRGNSHPPESRLREALEKIAEGNLGDAPWQANYEKIKEVARSALAEGADDE